MKNPIEIVLKNYLKNNISKELFHKSLDNYFEKSKAKQLQAKHPNSQWKTIKGAKVLVGENGNVIAGAGGRLTKKEEKEPTGMAALLAKRSEATSRKDSNVHLEALLNQIYGEPLGQSMLG